MAKISTSLRDFLEVLESENQLIRIKEEVNPEPDIGAAEERQQIQRKNRLCFLKK